MARLKQIGKIGIVGAIIGLLILSTVLITININTSSAKADNTKEKANYTNGNIMILTYLNSWWDNAMYNGQGGLPIQDYPEIKQTGTRFRQATATVGTQDYIQIANLNNLNLAQLQQTGTNMDNITANERLYLFNYTDSIVTYNNIEFDTGYIDIESIETTGEGEYGYIYELNVNYANENSLENGYYINQVIINGWNAGDKIQAYVQYNYNNTIVKQTVYDEIMQTESADYYSLYKKFQAQNNMKYNNIKIIIYWYVNGETNRSISSNDICAFGTYISSNNTLEMVGDEAVYTTDYKKWEVNTLNIYELTDYYANIEGNTRYNDGYNAGKRDGLKEGYTNGENSGYDKGYERGKAAGVNIGKYEGQQTANTNNWSALFSAIYNAPITAFFGYYEPNTGMRVGGLFNLNLPIGGQTINFSNFLSALLSICIVALVAKFAIKVFV